MDKLKDQDSAAPAATDDKKTISPKKTSKNATVIINPPEKLDPQRGFNERFKVALTKHTVILEKKTEIVLNAKANSAELPEETVIQVYTRGYKTLPLNSNLTREQYAMNRVNSFIAGGAAMMEDCDLLPIVERVGIKGTGGAMRPHIKREKNVYNGKTMFHVVNSKGQVKHSTSDQMQAKKHLAQKYHSYMKEAVHIDELSKGTLNNYMWSAMSDRKKTDAKVSKAMDKNAKQFSSKRHANITKLLDKSAKRSQGIIRSTEKQIKMNEKFWDNEGEMAIAQLKAICAKAEAIMSKIKNDSKLEAWIQSEITTADNSIDCIHDHLMYGKDAIGEASSPAIRMQRALDKIKADRERKERLAAPYVNSVFDKKDEKQPQEKK
jgi:hypothetical protein